MNIKELKELIANLPDEMEIILQKDSEGNGYSPCAGGDPDCVYEEETTWSGDVYDPSWTAEDTDMEEEDWAKIQQKPRVLVLYPIN